MSGKYWSIRTFIIIVISTHFTKSKVSGVYKSQLEYRTEPPSYLNHRLSYILLMVEACRTLFRCIATSHFINAQYLINSWSITPKTTTMISNNFVDFWRFRHRAIHHHHHHHHHPTLSQVIHFAMYTHTHTHTCILWKKFVHFSSLRCWVTLPANHTVPIFVNMTLFDIEHKLWSQ